MPSIFDAIDVGEMKIKNRFVHSATCEQMATPDGFITEEILKRYGRLAEGGIGLIIPGHMYVHRSGQAQQRQIGIYGDELVAGLEKLAGAVHTHGGKIAFQLAHGGRQSPRAIIGQAPLAPTGRGLDPVSLNKPRPMDGAAIEETIHAFTAAARRAAAAGADAVQIHAAHGYLLNEFLSPFFNKRKDGYGASAEGRFRILKEIISNVREALPKSMPILVKLNANDFTPRTGITPDLAAVYAKWLAAMGVAAVEVSGGTYYGFQTIRGEIPGAEISRALPAWMRPFARIKMKFQIPANRFQDAFNLGAAETIRPALNGCALILVGGLRRLDQMNAVIARGAADMIALSRPLIREPSLVRKFIEGSSEESTCTSCNRCFAAMFNNMEVRCYQKGLP
ncbi:MAG: NADH:flavin oxidoreductase [Desulfobacteraceae bacterium]|nr:NADH:flavin oxidoreductase [Desulfobacteraceae bacterium]